MRRSCVDCFDGGGEGPAAVEDVGKTDYDGRGRRHQKSGPSSARSCSGTDLLSPISPRSATPGDRNSGLDLGLGVAHVAKKSGSNPEGHRSVQGAFKVHSHDPVRIYDYQGRPEIA